MKKENLRSLGVGLLIASLLTAAYATFVQGNVPIEGVTLPSLLNGQEASLLKDKVEKGEARLEKLTSEKEDLSQQVEKLTADKESLIEKLDKQRESIDYLESLRNKDDETADQDESSANSNEESSNNSNQTLADGSFVINQGESASQIAQRLETEGFIESATEFQNLIDQWQLGSLIQTGEYQLSSDMSIHEIASQLTNGAYYYQ
ncbi:endolytic transglycosylase MltG [Facklamia miroungae]|uniref:YceG-like family protein n=1 Tax=Facklamia miroungae TaxID=120956 RepID=A0A1G7V9F0_9LACT|nr:endolytic transglycosylase MltG [Facklamia miroungae]NKZ30271.1 endolytic transglycosylase MltG [Facklamia miroungae]SDG56198.1 YceG-like family protein [Facklamia miroungae]